MTNWYVTGDSYEQIGRFSMFDIVNSSSQSNIQFRSLDINGDAGWTGNSYVGGNPTTGDGWDMTHKAFLLCGGGTLSNLLLFNSTVENWRGEEFYNSATNSTGVSVIQCTFLSTNADAISAGPMTVAYTTIGGTTKGSDVGEAIENALVVGQLKVNHCMVQATTNRMSNSNGIAYLGQPGASMLIENSTICGWNMGILYSEYANNVTVTGNTFYGNNAAMATSDLGQYSSIASTWSNFNITDNYSIEYGPFFLSQFPAPGVSFPNLNISDNTLANPDPSYSYGCGLLDGSCYGPAGSWTNFTVADNTLGKGVTDLCTYSGGNQFAIWSGTVRTGGNATASDVVSGSGTVSGTPVTDLTLLQGSGTCTFTLAGSAANYPVGFSTLLLPQSGTWTVQAGSWNNFSGNVAVPAAGLRLTVNSQQQFTLASTQAAPVLWGSRARPWPMWPAAPRRPSPRRWRSTTPAARPSPVPR